MVFGENESDINITDILKLKSKMEIMGRIKYCYFNRGGGYSYNDKDTY
jgi:hypothetical protein